MPRRLGAFLLVAPLLAGLLLGFLGPIAGFLLRAVRDVEVAAALPATLRSLRDWDGGTVPDEAFAALATDLRAARLRDRATGAGILARAGARLNHAAPGLRSLLPATARRVAEPGEDRARILAAGAAWSSPATWAAIRAAGGPLTDLHLLAAFDLRRGVAGIEAVPAEARLYRQVVLRTVAIGASVTLACLLLGYPLAWLIATAPPRAAPWMLGAVLLPFWTSLVVRSAAWMVLLQREGVVNATLLRAGLVEAPLPLLFNRFAVLVAMVHILLPFMVLPILAALREIDPRLPRAAASLGAGPVRVFRRVVLPLSLPGVGAGCLLVLVQALGFYVTPALLGGPEDQMLAWFIGFNASRTVNWSMAAALSLVLLAAIALLVGLYGRLVGFQRVAPA
ncbi:ABC transporter permease [Falsiroseomonas selenitidurans]|uniref:ABC transporter permease n=1 Tax=Falsiroseomonas selenitidurans TaxID=2716335 RepID=A0ABX1E6Z9_9PROT|nr:ABC transporter permease [Falsiroseomonas selenitidurans]NKC32964.1 ABC transporter permease [Falsiroseomonas selenitidurans]